ncbi:MAG: TerB family tellurite resistance protein [Rhodospirillaceae bacterium]
MYVDKLRDRFGVSRTTGAGGIARDKVPVAVSYFLVQAAKLDGSYDSGERKRVKTLLERRFRLSSIESNRLVVEAEDAHIDAAGDTSHIEALTAAFSIEERLGIYDMLWDVVFSDGVVDASEERMMASMAQLLSLSAEEAAASRARVGARWNRA